MKSVILFTSTVCPKCLLVKSLLKGASIPYKEHNIAKEEDKATELREAGYLTVPVLKDLDGNLLSEVLDMERYIEKLAPESVVI